MATSPKQERARKAAEALAEQQRREAKRRRINIGGVVVVVAVIVVVGVLLSRLTATTTEVSAPPAGSSDYGVTIGEESAPHDVVIYEDFLCPFCGELESETSEQLAALAAEGEVRVDYRPFQLLSADYSAQALNAFKVVLDAAGPEVAVAFHNELYADQPDERGPFPDADWLVDKAVSAGADEAAVRPGIEDESQQAWAEAATAAAQDSGVRSTPTILLDGEVFPAEGSVADTAEALIAAVS